MAPPVKSAAKPVQKVRKGLLNSSQAVRGLTSQAAAKKQVGALRGVLHAYARKQYSAGPELHRRVCRARCLHGQDVHIAAVAWVLALGAFVLLGVHGIRQAGWPALHLVLLLALLAGLAAAAVGATRCRVQGLVWQRLRRVQTLVRQFEQVTLASKPRPPPAPTAGASVSEAAARLDDAARTTSAQPPSAGNFVLAYRDSAWSWQPVHMLVPEDVIALPAQSVAPATLQCLDDAAHGGVLGRVIRCGETIPAQVSASRDTDASAAVATATAKHVRIPAQRARDALTVCGDVRRYLVIDNPSTALLDRQIRAPPKLTPIPISQARVWTSAVNRVQLLLLLGVAGVLIARVIVQAGRGELAAVALSQAVHMLVAVSPACLLLLLAPLLLGMDAVTTAQLRRALDTARLRYAWKEWLSDVRLAAQRLHASGQGAPSESSSRFYAHRRRSESDLWIGQRRCMPAWWPWCRIQRMPTPPRPPTLGDLVRKSSVNTSTASEHQAALRQALQHVPSVARVDVYGTPCPVSSLLPAPNAVVPWWQLSTSISTQAGCCFRAATALRWRACVQCIAREHAAVALREEDPAEIAAWHELLVELQEDGRLHAGAHRADRCGQWMWRCCCCAGMRVCAPCAACAPVMQSPASAVCTHCVRNSAARRLCCCGPPREWITGQERKPVMEKIWMVHAVVPTLRDAWRSLATPITAFATTPATSLARAAVRRSHNSAHGAARHGAPGAGQAGKPAAASTAEPAEVGYCARWCRPRGKFACLEQVCCCNCSSLCCKRTIAGTSAPAPLAARVRLGFGLHESRTPALDTAAVAMLGSTTTLVAADRDTVCQAKPVTENVLMPRSDGEVVILDCHADGRAPHGVRFSNPSWREYLEGLKPIALAGSVTGRKLVPGVGTSAAGLLKDLWQPRKARAGRARTRVRRPAREAQLTASTTLPSHTKSTRNTLHQLTRASILEQPAASPASDRPMLTGSATQPAFSAAPLPQAPSTAPTPAAGAVGTTAAGDVPMNDAASACGSIGDGWTATESLLLEAHVQGQASKRTRPRDIRARRGSGDSSVRTGSHSVAASSGGEGTDGARAPLAVTKMPKLVASADVRGLMHLGLATSTPDHRSWFEALACEIGAGAEQAAVFEHVRHVHTLCSAAAVAGVSSNTAMVGLARGARKAHKRSPVLPSSPLIAPPRRPGMQLQPAITTSVVRDKRNGAVTAMSVGSLPEVLARCAYYWDGQAVARMPRRKLLAILDTWRHWRAGDLQCVGVSFAPLVDRQRQALQALEEVAAAQDTAIKARAAQALRVALQRRMARNKSEGSAILSPESADAALSEQPAEALSALLGEHDESRRPAPHDIDIGLSVSHSAVYLLAPPQDWTKSLQPAPQPVLATDRLSAILEQRLQEIPLDSIFVGLVAARYWPRERVSHLTSACSAAGVRFVYTTQRDYIGAQPLAQKLGIETGWNCAVCLRPNSACASPQASHTVPDTAWFGAQASAGVPGTVSEPDDGADLTTAGLHLEHDAARAGSPASASRVKFEEPQAGTSAPEPSAASHPASGAAVISHAELAAGRENWQSRMHGWDRKAHLPHGLAEIRRHLEEADNVPLLVPLLTDASPLATRGMLRIMQEYGECVAVLGSPLRAMSAATFAVADVAVAVAPDTQAGPVRLDASSAGTPAGMAPSQRAAWTALAHGLSTIGCAAVLPAARTPYVIAKGLLWESRRSLATMRQGLVYIAWLGTVVLLTQLAHVAAGLPPLFQGVDAAMFMIAACCCMVLAMLFAPIEPDATGKGATPSKRTDLLGNAMLQPIISEEVARTEGLFAVEEQPTEPGQLEPMPESAVRVIQWADPFTAVASQASQVQGGEPVWQQSESLLRAADEYWSGVAGWQHADIPVAPVKPQVVAAPASLSAPRGALYYSLALVAAAVVPAAVVTLVHTTTAADFDFVGVCEDSVVCVPTELTLATVETAAARWTAWLVLAAVAASSAPHFQFRNYQAWQYNPCYNVALVIGCGLFFMLCAAWAVAWFAVQASFSAVSVSQALEAAGHALWIAMAWLIPAILASTLGVLVVKSADMWRSDHAARSARAHFDTRLGMLSPR